MLKTNTEEKGQITAVEILVMGVMVLCTIIAIPFNIAYMILILKTNRKERYVFCSCLIIIVLLCNRIGLFLEETAHIAVTLIKGLLKHKLIISAYAHYSLTSWILLAAFSFAVASYAVKRIRFNRTLAEVGVNSFERKYTKNGGGQCSFCN